MSIKILEELRHYLNLYRCSGGKMHRYNQANHLTRILLNIAEHEEITSIYQLGRKHVSRYWLRRQAYSDLTKRDEYYALCYLWNKILKRETRPPKWINHQ